MNANRRHLGITAIGHEENGCELLLLMPDHSYELTTHLIARMEGNLAKVIVITYIRLNLMPLPYGVSCLAF